MEKKKTDQYFMVDEGVLDRMCGYANLSRKDRVLEVGAGGGNLTTKLADSGAKVFAVEKDGELFHELEDRISGYSNVEVTLGDALKIDSQTSTRSSQTYLIAYRRKSRCGSWNTGLRSEY